MRQRMPTVLVAVARYLLAATWPPARHRACNVAVRVAMGTLVMFACLLGSPTPANAQRITIGKEVLVSADRKTQPHEEVQIAVDPRNGNRLLACSHIFD